MLVIVQHNVNTWFNKRYELCHKYRLINPDIILLNHTGIVRGTGPPLAYPPPQELLRIQHYTTYTSNKDNTPHSGTAIAVKNTIPHTIIDDFNTNLIAINVDTPQGTITIGTDYLPPNKRYLDIPEYVTLLGRRNPVYIFGDLNARHSFLSHRDQNPVGKGLNTLIQRDIITHIGPHFPTFIRTNCATTPDIAITNKVTFHNILLTPGPVSASDHIPVIAKITANPIQIPIKPRPHFTRADWESYKNELESHSTPNLTEADTIDIDTAINEWTEQVKQASNHHIPTLQYRVIPGANQNEEIRNTQRELDETYELIRTHGPLQTHTDRLGRLRIKIRELYRQDSTQTWNNIIHQIEIPSPEEPQKFWKSFKRFQGNQKQKMPYLKDHHNQKIQTAAGKEALFTNHMEEIYKNDPGEEEADSDPNIEDHIQAVESFVADNIDSFMPHPRADATRLDPIQFPPLTTEEVKKLIHSLKQKTPGPSGITATHLKHLPDSMILRLTDIFNKTMSLGYFPEPFKESHTIFIPKAGTQQHSITNYRPIALLETHGKLLDKIINKRLQAQLQFNNAVNPRQHGFTQKRGTQTALATIYESLANARLEKQKAYLVLRDISKAFDKVWHCGLRRKIHDINMPDCLKRLLSSYLVERKTAVRIESHLGPNINLEKGVPQGGCLSPTLYNLYTRDTPPPTPYSDYVMYADDLTQIITYPSKNLLAHHTARAIEAINVFERRWKIETNMGKFTTIPIFHNGSVEPDTEPRIQVSLGGGKVLGLTVGRYCLGQHVTNRINSASYHLNNLYKFRNLSEGNKKKLFKATVLPSLIYPAVPLNTLSVRQFKRLQVKQNDALRMIGNVTKWDRPNMTQLHRRLEIDPLNITVHKLAKTTWEKIKDNHPDIYSNLHKDHPQPRQETYYWPSSRARAELPPPYPIYTTNTIVPRYNLRTHDEQWT